MEAEFDVFKACWSYSSEDTRFICFGEIEICSFRNVSNSLVRAYS